MFMLRSAMLLPCPMPDNNKGNAALTLPLSWRLEYPGAMLDHQYDRSSITKYVCLVLMSMQVPTESASLQCLFRVGMRQKQGTPENSATNARLSDKNEAAIGKKCRQTLLYRYSSPSVTTICITESSIITDFWQNRTLPQKIRGFLQST